MLPDLFGVDLCSLYQSNKDIAVAVAGGAYPVGKFLIWSGTRMASVGYTMTKWALTKAPPAPLEEAVAVLVENVGKASRLYEDEKTLVFGMVRVDSRDGSVKIGQRAVPYGPHEVKAIKAAAKARLAEIAASEHDTLREQAALGN